MKKTHIRLCADYSASGFEVDYSYHDPEEFGLPPEICKELADWENMFEDMFRLGERSPPRDELDKLNEKGRQILLKIKKFLGEEKYTYELYEYKINGIA